MKNLFLLMRITIAFIFIQSLFYKFTGHAEAVYIFTTIGMEPFGRIGIGIAELIVSILLFVPKTKIISLLGCFGLMSGAIFFHLTTELGTVVSWNEYESDNGLLFVMAITALILSMIMLLNYYSKNLPLNSLRKIIGFKNE